MGRKVRVLVGDSDLCLGEATDRAAALIVLVLAEAERINAPGLPKIVVDDSNRGLRMMLTYRGAAAPDCAGMAPD